jgi:hypothetical protein
MMSGIFRSDAKLGRLKYSSSTAVTDRGGIVFFFRVFLAAVSEVE